MLFIVIFGFAITSVAVDCQQEYRNAVNNRNLPNFWNRCKTDDSFRRRCSLCAGAPSVFFDNPPPSLPPTSNWVVGPWSSCSVSCGNGIQTRVVECPSSTSSDCGFQAKTERVCSMSPCLPELKPTSITCNGWNTRIMDCSRDLSLLEQATGTSWKCSQYIFPENQGSLRAAHSKTCESQLEKLNAFDRRIEWHCAGGDKSFPVPGIQGQKQTCDTSVAILNKILGGLIEHEPRMTCHDFDGYYMVNGWDGELSLSIYQKDDCKAEVCHLGGDSCVTNVLAKDDSIMGATLNDRKELVVKFSTETLNFIHIKQEYCDQENYQCSEPNAYCGFGVNNDKCWCGNPDFPRACNKPLEDQWHMFKVDGKKSCTSECNAMGLTCSSQAPALDTPAKMEEVVSSLGGQCLYFRGPWKGPWSPGYRPTDGRCMMKHQIHGQHCNEVLRYNSEKDYQNFDNRKLCFCTVEN